MKSEGELMSDRCCCFRDIVIIRCHVWDFSLFGDIMILRDQLSFSSISLSRSPTRVHHTRCCDSSFDPLHQRFVVGRAWQQHYHVDDDEL